MKKESIFKIVISVLLVIVVVLSFFIKNPNSMEKINVYLFWGNGCPHCEHAKEFFSNIEDEYGKYFELVDYEVWYSEENSNLLTKVKDELKDTSTGVPFILIGDNKFVGYSSSIDEQIKETITKEYKNENYTDIVEKVK